MTRLSAALRRQPPLLATMLEFLAVGPGIAGLTAITVLTVAAAVTTGAAAALEVFAASTAPTLTIAYALARAAREAEEDQRLADRVRDTARAGASTAVRGLMFLPTLIPTIPASTTPASTTSGITPTGSGGNPFPHVLPGWVELTIVVAGVLFLTARTPSIFRYPLWFVLALAVVGAYVNAHQHPDFRSVCLLGTGTAFTSALLLALARGRGHRRRRGHHLGLIVTLLIVGFGFTFPLLFTIGGG